MSVYGFYMSVEGVDGHEWRGSRIVWMRGNLIPPIMALYVVFLA